MPDNKKNTGLNISVRSYLTALVVIFILMVFTFVMTLVIPAGQYQYDASGALIEGSFAYTGGGISIIKWILSPLLVLGADGGFMLIAVIIFLLIIGGVFYCLGAADLTRYLLEKITAKFGNSRYRLMAVLILFFMAMGSLIGSFEECVPLVPIVVGLAVNLGWDAITGIAMSILAAGCGFAAGVFNPFTVGVAQELAGLPMFSGAAGRLAAFAAIYALLLFFVRRHAAKVERPVADASVSGFKQDRRMDRGVFLFVSILGIGILVVLLSAVVPMLRDITIPVVALMFLIAGTVSSFAVGFKGKAFFKEFNAGVKAVFPAVLMILMASSIKYTLTEAKVIDTILHSCVGIAGHLPKFAVILFIYLIVLVMNFFIASGSAKAFMLIPLVTPIAAVFGIPAQLCIMAFAFGDGFSNVFYPTNPVLLLSLGVADLSYADWVKWSWKFQLANLVLTSGLLLAGLAVGYC